MSDLEVLKAELQSLQNAPILAADKAASSGLLDLEISNRPDVRQLEAQLDELKQAILTVQNKRRSKIGDNWQKDPEYQHLRDVTEEKKTELKALKDKARKELVELNLEQQKVEQERRMAEKMREIAALNTRRQMLDRKVLPHIWRI